VAGFFCTRKKSGPRSDSDAAVHRVLCDVPSENLSKGAPSAGGPARTWNSQANEEQKGQFSFDRRNEYLYLKNETNSVSKIYSKFLNPIILVEACKD